MVTIAMRQASSKGEGARDAPGARDQRLAGPAPRARGRDDHSDRREVSGLDDGCGHAVDTEGVLLVVDGDLTRCGQLQPAWIHDRVPGEVVQGMARQVLVAV